MAKVELQVRSYIIVLHVLQCNALGVPAHPGPLPSPGVGAVSEDSSAVTIASPHQLESRASYGREGGSSGAELCCAASSVEKAGWDCGQTVSWRALDTIPVPSALIKLRFSELKMEMLQ